MKTELELTVEDIIDSAFLNAKEYGETKISGIIDTLILRYIDQDVYLCFSAVHANSGRTKTKKEIKDILQDFLKFKNGISKK